MKRKIIIISILFLLGASCAGSTESAATITPDTIEVETPTLDPSLIPTQSVKTPTPLPDEVTLVRFWHPWAGEDALVIQSLVADFMSQNQNIMVEVNSLANEDFLVSNLIEAMDSEELPEIIVAPGSFLKELYAENFLINLNGLIEDETSGWNNDKIKSFPTVFWNHDLIEEQRFGIPAQWNLHLLYYNQDWAEEMGFEKPPSDPDQFLNQVCAAARFNLVDDDADNNGTGGWIYDIDPITMLSWMNVFSGGLDLESFEINIDQNVNAFEYLWNIFRIDCSWVGRELEPYNYFANRNAIIYSGSIEDLKTQTNVFMMSEGDDTWTLIPYPGEQGKPIVLSENWSYGITQASEEKQKASWEFIKWMLESQNYAKLIQSTYSLPVSLDVLPELVEFIEENPIWEKLLQFIPLVQPIPDSPNWSVIRGLLQDLGWQLSVFTTNEADIPLLSENLESMAKEILNEGE